MADGATGDAGEGPCDCDDGGHRRPIGDWLCPPCDMIQHLPYPPCLHGYYYFRPYNAAMLLEQREIAIHWGGDPRHPYADEIFERVYKELEPRSKPVSKDTSSKDKVPAESVPAPKPTK